MLRTVTDIDCVVRMQSMISNEIVLRNTIIKMFLRQRPGELSLSIILIFSEILLIFSSDSVTELGGGREAGVCKAVKLARPEITG